MSDKVYQIIQESILKKLEEGVIPWRKTWSLKEGMPRNIITNKPYSGFNLFQLLCQCRNSPYWMTKKQIKQLNGTVDFEKEQSTLIVYWKFLEETNDQGEVTKKFPMIRYYHIYNLDQVEGITCKWEKEIPLYNNSPIENCEKIHKEYRDCPEIVWDKSPSYNFGSDKIGMPKLQNFKSSESYYATLFHEIGHSTGHLTRCNRDYQTSYAKEELVAEMAAAFLCGMAGIETETIQNQAAYIKGWKEKISKEPRIVIQAATLAQKAANYILNINEFNQESKAA